MHSADEHTGLGLGAQDSPHPGPLPRERGQILSRERGQNFSRERGRSHFREKESRLVRERECSGGGIGLGGFGVRWVVALAVVVAGVVLAPQVSLHAADGTAQERAVARLNELRAHAQVAPVRADAALRRAAEGHAAYYALHGFSGHGQEPTRPGFTGTAPADRIRAAGFDGRCSGESATSMAGDPAAAVDALVNSVYHRTVMLHPALTLVGFAQSAGGSVFAFGGCRDDAPRVERLHVYPGAGQTDVPHSFLPRSERPNPLPEAAGFVGSPISIGLSPWADAPPALDEVRIVDQSGVLLPYRRVDDGGWAYFITVLPLGAGQTHTVSVVGTAGGGIGTFARAWSFTTQSAFLPRTLRLRFTQGPPRLLTEYEAEDIACYGQTADSFSPTLAGSALMLPCYDVMDVSEAYGAAPFLTTFRRLGGVNGLGYPLTRAITYEGKATQLFQKGVLQWQPSTRSFTYLAIFDILSERGFDEALANEHLIPPPADTAAEAGMTWDEIVARRVAMLERAPPIAAFVLDTPRWLERYGLPVSVHDYGDVVVLRAQRAAFQWWQVDTSFARAGDVTVVNSGEIAKALGGLVR